ncbi:MAG: TIGR04076 family protein [Candidatus Heimdallarchaeaceae archaeon]
MSYIIKVEVLEQHGHCAAGHKIGDEVIFDFEKNEIKGKICFHALYSMFPKIFAMAYGASFPWLKDPDYATHACPDAYNPVIFAVKRTKKKE